MHTTGRRTGHPVIDSPNPAGLRQFDPGIPHRSRSVLQRSALWQVQSLSQRHDPFIQTRHVPCALGFSGLIQRQLGMANQIRSLPLAPGDFCHRGMFYRLIDVAIEKCILPNQPDTLIALHRNWSILIGIAKRMRRYSNTCSANNKSSTE
jgi:hypothetical protein